MRWSKTLGALMIHGLAARWRGDRLIPHHDIGPRTRAPRLALVAELGDPSLNGLFVLSRLATFLQEIEADQRPGLRLRERILIIPADGNALDEQETDAKRIAWAQWPRTEAVLALTRLAYYRVEIHPASLDIEEMPQVRLYAPHDDERASACLFGLPAVIERPVEPRDALGLLRIWRLYGGENFAIHAGQAGSLQTVYCETLFRALVAFLDRTGIVSGLPLAEEEEDLRYFGLRQIFVVRAEHSGVFSSCQTVGRWVRAGEDLGCVHDDFTGNERARILAPVTGLLSSLCRQPLLRAGDLVARILVAENPTQHRRTRRTGERHEQRCVQRF